MKKYIEYTASVRWKHDVLYLEMGGKSRGDALYQLIGAATMWGEHKEHFNYYDWSTLRIREIVQWEPEPGDVVQRHTGIVVSGRFLPSQYDTNRVTGGWDLH